VGVGKMKDLTRLSFNELIEMIADKNCLCDKFIVCENLESTCRLYDQAKKAFFVTRKYCATPFYGFLELMLSYAEYFDIPELIEIYEQEEMLKCLEEDECEPFLGRAIDQFDDLCRLVLDKHSYTIAKRHNSYEIKDIVNIYNIAPKESYTKNKVLSMLIHDINHLVSKPDKATRRRLSVVSKLCVDNYEIKLMQKKANEMLTNGSYRSCRTEPKKQRAYASHKA
jgi:hypothetical protein